jgi:hypothetical protein
VSARQLAVLLAPFKQNLNLIAAPALPHLARSQPRNPVLLTRLCAAVRALESLELARSCHADFLLRRGALFRHLCRLDAAVLDFALLATLPRLEDLTLRCRFGEARAPPPTAALAPTQLAHLSRAPFMTRLAFAGFSKVPLGAVALPRLRELAVTARAVEGDAQDAFEWSLPALPPGHRLQKLVVRGPENFSAAGLPYETPLDLAAAAAACEEIEVSCNSLVLLDRVGAADADPGWAERHVADALQRGAAWRRIEWRFWNARCLTRRSRMVADVQVRSLAGEGGVPDLDEVGMPAALRAQLRAAFGEAVALDFSDAPLRDFGANLDVPAQCYTLRRVGEGAQRIASLFLQARGV